MTNQNQTLSNEAGPEEHSSAASISVSRRTVLQMAGGVVSLASVSHAEAQSSPPTVTTSGVTGPVRLVVNGTARELQVDSRQSLLDVLRETLDLTGTKKGCNQGACGACTILLNGRRIVSCLTLASMHDGAEIETIEGLERNGELHPLQQAFVEHEGLQCGFCTPGQIMSGLGCIAEGHAASPEDIRFWMSGNICRCGAYPGIVAAIADAAERS
ncbi:xanthine dehydrogenase YagT iron-sulfur-binding subunit [Rhizobium sp. BK181]|uniref:(2Fe-2S)-binding protein n=1 Tax=Rhizobium sp. BK181 TaxID=2587072 RepID=UPI00160F1E85|nr:(2Fe-2S)-binding protein [Rhizobium sp. BK181]MBB3314863.1 xanthine dehydrogenase YagT iron-sulfur-binding subunit [Rhizobium sp. BK181]